MLGTIKKTVMVEVNFIACDQFDIGNLDDVDKFITNLSSINKEKNKGIKIR